ncbi:MAG: RdgB/HAM1 family non-canonical purine NTP pyrophosphatase [Weeksellaceae bacterium]
MKNTIIFATHNTHKAQEVNAMLPSLKVISLQEINFLEDIEETGSTFKENAAIKAETIYNKVRQDVFADDSGLVIPALDGAPGIYSARYAGTGNAIDNIHKVLKELENINDRRAYFITVICYITGGKKHYFEGKVHGTILQEIEGEGGFGYDPIFRPDGYNKSFASFTKEEKNAISHRSKAIKQFYNYIVSKFEN